MICVATRCLVGVKVLYFVCTVTDSGTMSSTMCALSSVARLSVSMTMLMSSGAHRKRLYVDGMIGSASSAGVDASQATCSKYRAVVGEDEPISSGPTPPSAQLSKASHHRHLWKLTAKRAMSATTGRAVSQRGKRVPPVRIESLPNMWNEAMTTPPESAASARRKVYGNGGRRRMQASSVSGARRHRSHSGAGVSGSDAMTTEESSTSCGEDSSDGQVFDIIREESIKRPSGRGAVQQNGNTDALVAVTAATQSTSGSSPVNNSGISIVIDNHDTSTDTPVLPSDSSSPLLSTASSPGKQQQQQQVDGRTSSSVCQQSGSKTFLLSEVT